jgi:hypothetical protein
LVRYVKLPLEFDFCGDGLQSGGTQHAGPNAAKARRLAQMGLL